MLVSNVFRTYIDDYKMKKSNIGFEGLVDLLEQSYTKGQISKYDYEKFLNELGSLCVKNG